MSGTVCPHGTTCRFEHSGGAGAGGDATSVPPGRAAVCEIFALEGICNNGDRCPFLHNSGGVSVSAPVHVADPTSGTSKVKICRKFVAHGTCTAGDACRFVHDASAGRTTVAKDSGAAVRGATGRSDAVCHSFSSRGSCAAGASCRFQHELGEAKADDPDGGASVRGSVTGPPSRKICRNFTSRGACAAGDSCRFRHITSEHVSVGGGASGTGGFVPAAPEPRGPAPAPAAPVPRPAAPLAADGEPKVCRNYTSRGFCMNGDTCRFLHPSPAHLAVIKANKDLERRQRAAVAKAMAQQDAADARAAAYQQAQLERVARYNWTAVHSAAWDGNVALLRMLFEEGADFTARTTEAYPVQWSEYDSGAHETDSYKVVFPPGTTPLRVAQSTSADLVRDEPGFTDVAVTQNLADACYGRERRAETITFLESLGLTE